MYYFAGVGVSYSIAGIDRAYINRLKLFQKHRIPAKILTVQYSHLAYENLLKKGLEKDTINMYDYFQRCSSEHLQTQTNLMHYWEHECGYIIEVVPHQLDIRVKDQNHQLIMYARFFTIERTHINFIYYFQNGKLIKHEMYDYRGFLSATHYYAEGEKYTLEEFYTPSGIKVIEKHYTIDSDIPYVIYVKDLMNQTHRFNKETEMITFFIESIHRAGDTFIVDRPYELSEAFYHTHPSIKKVLFFHSIHLLNNEDFDTFKWPYQYTREHLNMYHALICSTEAQKADLLQVSQYDGDVFAIPVGYFDKAPKHIQKKQPYRITSVGRYVYNKQLDHQIRVIHRLKQEFNEIQFDIYGFGGPGSAHESLQQLIEELNAEDYIHLRGFENNIEDMYKDSVLSLFTSQFEGFGLAILESFQNNTPVFSYDIKYGPNEMIQDGINGNLVPLNDENALYEKIKTYLSSHELQQTYTSACYQSIEKYSEDKNIELWREFMKKF
ncbi:accessory Sec system glycosyltransferase Asp1 [Macrococcus sp. DPC7161]|uniref:accessory Sec system glycosyltransferase Asp1 n=1 Tax=Macrococcus sp. DPC7161 TaxID=2507060 RepID=UPI00100A8EB6|nr:accessory Sec system glycosyltransferase Asp1 [Macrococcus sp. DPC7161]RXK17626.1 accessory Sec system glycosyltransferase Asp1 [Macrococcus sp. DPC7161]